MQLKVLTIGFLIIKNKKIINRPNLIRFIIFLRPQRIKIFLEIKVVIKVVKVIKFRI